MLGMSIKSAFVVVVFVSPCLVLFRLFQNGHLVVPSVWLYHRHCFLVVLKWKYKVNFFFYAVFWGGGRAIFVSETSINSLYTVFVKFIAASSLFSGQKILS